ncbi:mechanosensitive ion channel family protein [Segnochrobactraceae bacterium EtOH-i3]
MPQVADIRGPRVSGRTDAGRWPVRSRVGPAFLLLLAFLLALPAGMGGTGSAAAASPVALMALAAPEEPKAPVQIADAGGIVIEQKLAALSEDASRLRLALRAAVESVRHFPVTVGAAIESAGSEWLGGAVLLAAIAIVLGSMVAWLVKSRLRRSWLAGQATGEVGPVDKISVMLMRGVIDLIGCGVLLAAGALAAEILDQNHSATRATVMVLLTAYVVMSVAIALARVVISPNAASVRLIALSDQDAKRLYRHVSVVFFFAALLLAFHEWLAILQVPQAESRLISIIISGLSVLLLAGLCYLDRKAIARAMMPAALEGARGVKAALVRHWHVLAILYFIVAWLVSSARRLLDLPGAAGLVVAPVVVGVFVMVLYAVLVLLIQRLVPRQPELRFVNPPHEKIPDFRDLLDEGAGFLCALVGLALILQLWGADFLFNRDWSGRVFEVILIGFCAWLLHGAVKIAIDRRIAEEGGPAGIPGQIHEHDEHPAGNVRSRLATLLPLARFAVLTAIIVMGIMIGLSELGVNIGPLFAGAGVIGLAVGFGSQALVKDIFSGAFFLIDDAFRIGEYIDIGSAKGTVEKISIRSFQLRHQNGPLTTIPFGSISKVQNFSRDWVIMKLPFRVPYDTDVEQVRKIVKKVGQQLLDDPESGPKFLAPLKSQGVYQMDDSALVMRMKFMTRPGDQFILRRQVYAEVQKALSAAGIRFASREVVVRIADDGPTVEDPEMRRKVAGAAARHVMEAQEGGTAQDPMSQATEGR